MQRIPNITADAVTAPKKKIKTKVGVPEVVRSITLEGIGVMLMADDIIVCAVCSQS
jgi:hypothetical protein